VKHRLVTFSKLALKRQHRARLRQVDQPDDMAATLMFEHRSLRTRRHTRLVAPIEQAPEPLAKIVTLQGRGFVHSRPPFAPLPNKWSLSGGWQSLFVGG